MTIRAPTSITAVARPSRARALIAAGAAGALIAAASLNRRRAQEAERANPPEGAFITIDGVRLHYVERGEGEPLVLLHGNGSMIQDFTSSGLVDMAAKTFRAIVFDRPGYGYSDRPRGRIWTQAAQADLLAGALTRLHIEGAVTLGHSWGAALAVTLALRHPRLVSALVLASGYYYPTVRVDAAFIAVPAIPVIGDALSETLAPLIGRRRWPEIIGGLFEPNAPPAKFAGFPKEMALRPSQIRATAGDAGLLVPGALALRGAYAGLKPPVVIIAGEEDRRIDIDEQSARLHAEIAGSSLRRLPGVGHMVHQNATAEVMAAIEEARERARREREFERAA